MDARTNSTDKSIGSTQDSTFALHALLGYSASVLLIIFLGSRLQRYNLNLGLLVTEIAFIALPAIVVLLVHRKTLGDKLFSIPPKRQLSLTALIGGCVVLIAVYKGFAIRKALVGFDTGGVEVAGGISLILLVILAPWCEELLFRPVIQNGLARHWGPRTAVILTALLFALFHLSLLRFAETFVIGLFAGIVFLKTRNFWCPVIVHLICNALGPALWRSAPHLAFVFNPATVIGLACVALTGCYYIGERTPTALKGLWQRLRWAAFGTLESTRTTHKRSRMVAPLASAIILSLMVLLGYGTLVMHRLDAGEFDSNYVVSEKDEWTVVSSSRIHARSDLTIRTFPGNYEDLIMELPFPEATIQEVKHGNDDLPFSHGGGKREYRVDLSSPDAAPGSGAITVLWNFPLTCLTPDRKSGYRTPLKSLAPSDSFSLKLRIADESGFRFMGDNTTRTQQLFRWATDKPRMNYGSCGMMFVKRENRQTGSAQR